MSDHNTFKWLDLNKEEDEREWLRVWENTSHKQPHQHPSLLALTAPKGYNLVGVHYQHSANTQVLYPFYCYRVSSHPAFQDQYDFLHILSPYGYGGATIEGESSEFKEASERFLKLFNKELSKRNCVSEFVREHLFQELLVPREKGEAALQQENVVVRLNRSEDEIWKAYKHKVRKNVNKAIDEGLRVEFDHTSDRVEEFVSVYYETMNRNEASQAFYMPAAAFTHLIETLGKSKGAFLAHALLRDKIISTELLLLSTDVIYSFLGGTLASFYELRPNDLLKHEVILWGAKQDYKYYVLGGGASPGDGMFKYKAGFDPEGLMPFRVRQIIHNESAYRELVNQKKAYETRQGNTWSPTPNFFPEYLA